MKTRIVTLITLLTVILSISVTKAATKTNGNQITVLATSTNINKIEASGNVEVYITNGNKDQVKVYGNYYAQNALVQDKDGVLRISSYNKEKLVVLVTVANLRAITANDNASVKSDGTLSIPELDVKLNNTASAQLKLNTIAATITVNDRATANLVGNIDDYNLNYSQSSTINRTELVSVNRTEKNTTKKAVHIRRDDIASL